MAESIKISQSGKSNEADSIADKFSKVCSFVNLLRVILHVLCQAANWQVCEVLTDIGPAGPQEVLMLKAVSAFH